MIADRTQTACSWRSRATGDDTTTAASAAAAAAAAAAFCV